MRCTSLLLAAVSPFAMAAQDRQPTPLERYARAEAPGYVVLAPTQEEAEKYSEQVQFAIDQFARYFQENPPRITVLIAESSETLALPELRKLTAPGEALLPFLTEEKLALGGQGPAGNIYMLDAGAALAEKDGDIVVLSVLPLPGKDSIALEAGDILLEVNQQEVLGLDHLRELYAKVAIGEEVELLIQRRAQVRTVNYVRPERQPRAQIQPAAAGGALKLAQMRPLSHEVGHILLISYANHHLDRHNAAAKRPADVAEGQPVALRGHTYGHPKLPDWFDEAAATLAEGSELKAQRRSFLESNLEQRIPLAELFTMEHPMRALAAGLAQQRQDAQPGARVMALRVEDAGGVMQRAAMFYAQSQSFSQFLEEYAGEGTLRNVLHSLLSGQSTIDALGEIEAIPRDLAELDQAWIQWLGEP